MVHPERFARKPTQVNQANDGNVVPTVKLVKDLATHNINSGSDELSGYHVESLAIEAFRNYQGQYDLKSMVMHFNQFASKAVLKPIKAPTGQSRYVDDYMGAANSTRRRRASELFKWMQEKLSRCDTKKGLEDLFGL